MKIDIHIYPASFPKETGEFKIKMHKTLDQIRDYIDNATITPSSFTITETTLLDDKGFIIATVKIAP